MDCIRSIEFAGDYLLDQYIYGCMKGSRFVAESIEEMGGGALCALRHLNFLKSSDIDVKTICEPYEILRLTRYIVDDEVQLETHTYEYAPARFRSSFSDFYNSNNTIAIQWEPVHPLTTRTLLLSLYNKGMASTIYTTTKYDLLCVDCRYREFDARRINASTKIWHATGSEYDEVYAMQYDWVIHTDGPNQIEILRRQDNSLEQVCIIPVEPIEDRYTAGAGDAFTAALTARLTMQGPDTPFATEVIEDAVIHSMHYVHNCIIRSSSRTITPTL